LEIMTREEIITELKRLEPWFHCIDLGGGLTTKTESVMGEPVDHPHEPWQIIQKCLPRDLQGKSLLDVGCNAGFYSIQAKHRGAARVLGVDGQRQHIRQALLVRKVLGVDVEFRRMNVYELEPHALGQFDITLALGLIYHLKHLVLALENLYTVTREMLIIETAILPSELTMLPLTHPLGQAEMRLHPFALVENPRDAKEQVANWFLPSIEGLKALLKNIGFDSVEVVALKTERAVLICRKSALQSEGDVRHHLVARLSLEEGSQCCGPGEDLAFKIRVKNAGLRPWRMHGEDQSGKGAVQLGAHLLRSDEEELSWDYGRANLPNNLEPGAEAIISIGLQAPAKPGSYIVEFDMVEEHIAWFEDFGSGTLRHELGVS
jgi:tRNA (mo5U34)-methyltransferase